MSDGTTRFDSGAVRQSKVAGEKDHPARYDLVPTIGLRRLAETMAHGAEKYGEGNWQKGIPISNCLNHAIAHLVAWLDGDRSEDHFGHALANICFAAHFEEHAWSQCIIVPKGYSLVPDSNVPASPAGYRIVKDGGR